MPFLLAAPAPLCSQSLSLAASVMYHAVSLRITPSAIDKYEAIRPSEAYFAMEGVDLCLRELNKGGRQPHGGLPSP